MAETTSKVDVRAEALRVFRTGGDADDARRALAHAESGSRNADSRYLDPLLELIVDIYALTGANRNQPISMEGFVETYLAQYEFRGKVDKRNLHYALNYPALIEGGLRPDLGGDLYLWHSELWPYMLYAIEGYLRVAAERTGRSLPELAAAVPR